MDPDKLRPPQFPSATEYESTRAWKRRASAPQHRQFSRRAHRDNVQYAPERCSRTRLDWIEQQNSFGNLGFRELGLGCSFTRKDHTSVSFSLLEIVSKRTWQL